MPSSEPAHLATIRRGTAIEGIVRGHVAVVDAAGWVLSSAGDPHAITTLRSCAKPVQALPFVRDALPALDLTDAEVAIACASHGGEPVHLEVVRGLLSRVGLGEEALTCGPQLPMDEASATALLAAGGHASQLTNNCSGKHAGMLAVCSVRGWPTAGYAHPTHPLQAEISARIAALTGLDLAAGPAGIDGCGLPTFGVPLASLARLFAAASADPAFGRCQEAMAAHPHLVAGQGRFDTAVLEVAGAELTVKGGAAGVWVAVLRPAGPGLAIKLEAGDQSAMPAVAMAALERLGWLERAADAPRLSPHARPVLRNWAGTAVGEISAEPGWL